MNKFHIKVIDVDKKGFNRISAITNGIEEEGLPFFVDLNPKDKTNEYLLDENEKSSLGVIIAVYSEKVSLYYREYKEKRPYIEYDVSKWNSLESYRMIGQNAARLIKKRPIYAIT